MKILIIMPKGVADGDRVNYSYLLHFGLAYISSVLKAAGYAVTCFNLHHYEGTVEKLVYDRLLDGTQYDVVCTGGLSAHYIQIKRIVNAINLSGTKPKIILWGGLVTSEPELIFNALNPDYVVLGEGEETIKELTSCLEQQRDPSNIAGIGYRNSDGDFVKTAPRKPIMDLDAIPWPDFDGFEYDVWLNNLKPTDDYLYDVFDYPRVYPIISSRSCPNRCTFCFHPLGNIYRQRSMDSVIEELEAMIPRHRINLVNIDDELFSYNTKRVYEFCERITQIARNVSWDLKWLCSMRADGLDEDMLVTMKKSGCIGVGFGFESYSSAVLKSMKKHITPAQIKRAVDLTLSHNISSFSFFIFGDRAETIHTVRQTLDFCKSIQCANIAFSHLLPYPGTEINAYCVEKGIIKDKMEYIENCCGSIVNMSENMSDREYYQSLVEIADCRIRHYTIAVPSSVCKDANGRYTLTIICPHCKTEVRYGNYSLPSLMIYNIMTYCRRCRRSFWMSSKTYLFITKTARILFSVTPMWIKIQIVKCFFLYVLPWSFKKNVVGHEKPINGNMNE